MKTLSRKKLFLYGLAGMGPNMLNLIVGSYLCDALMTEGFEENVANWTYCNKTLIVVGLWSILVTVAKIIDGIIDIPFGAMSDRFRSKWGNRRPCLLIGNVVMILSYIMLLTVPENREASLLNTFWFALWLIVFYAFYTLTMVTYYATFSEVTDNDVDRVFLSNVKSTMDIIYFILGYALVPVLVDAANIRVIAYGCIAFIATMLIPFFVLSEESTLGKEDAGKEVEKPSMLRSLSYTFGNRVFILWMIIYGVLQFGLSMYLTGFNVYYSGTMSYSGLFIMLCNVAAFGPVPFTLILYNKIVNKKGFKFGFQYSLLMFSIGMFCMVFARPSIFPNESVRIVCSIICGVICSFGIGAFFSIAYTVPSTIAAKEKEEKGISNPAMYFAVQGLFEACISAISTGVVWINLKKIGPDGSFLLSPGGGAGLLTLIVSVSCLISFILAFWLPEELRNVGKTK